MGSRPGVCRYSGVSSAVAWYRRLSPPRDPSPVHRDGWSNKDRDIGRGAIRSWREVSDAGETGIIQLTEADDHGALGRQEAADLPTGDVRINLLRREVDIDDVVGPQDRIEGQRHGGKRALRGNGPARLTDAVAPVAPVRSVSGATTSPTSLQVPVWMCAGRGTMGSAASGVASWAHAAGPPSATMPASAAAPPAVAIIFPNLMDPSFAIDARVPIEGSCLPAVFMPTETWMRGWTGVLKWGIPSGWPG